MNKLLKLLGIFTLLCNSNTFASNNDMSTMESIEDENLLNEKVDNIICILNSTNINNVTGNVQGQI